MSWKIRHQGSPKSIEGLTLEQVVEGLQDGQWEPTDEVMGPRDTNWVPIESHPQFAEIALDLEPPEPKVYDDETRLDMTPLIDVTMVLLIFFILTTSYAALQKMLEASDLTPQDTGATVINGPAKDSMILVTVKQRGAESVIALEGQELPKDSLKGALQAMVSRSRKLEMLLDTDGDVPHGIVVAVIDAAKGAGITKVHTVIPKDELPKK
jgi:biopolymer transport protein ExbD